MIATPNLKTPICSFDAKTGILCPKCESKVRSGHISKDDVEVSMVLTRLAEKIPELDKITLVRALRVNGDVILVLGAGDLPQLRRDPSIIKKLEDGLRTKVWLVEGEKSDRGILEDLFYPVKIVTVNIVWLPDGSKLTKVIVAGRRSEKFSLNIEKLKKIIRAMRGIDLLVEFER